MRNSRLIGRSVAGIVFLLAVMGLALFLPGGGTFKLGWVYLSIFSGCVVLITGYLFLCDKALLQSRLAAGPVAERSALQRGIQSAASLTFISIFVLSGIDHKSHWSTVPGWLSYACDFFCVLAFMLLFLVFKQNRFLSATIEVQEKQRVVSTGMYSIVRHPMYSMAIALMIFTPVALGSYWALLPVAILTLLIVGRAMDEERQLKRDLAGYEIYCRKVKYRMIPFVW